MKTPIFVAVGAVALAVVLIPFMLAFDAARPWIAIGSMAVGAALLAWRSVRRRSL